MENTKNKNVIIAVLVVIIIILSALIVLFATDIIVLNINTKNNNELPLKDNKDNKDNKNNDNTNNTTEKDKNTNIEGIDESNFIRETNTILIESVCYGENASLVATINSNGNILVTQDNKSLEIQTKNAKYLYRVGMIACDVFNLYYITEDKELYEVKQLDSITSTPKLTKVTEKKVIEFLGREWKNDEKYSNGEYLKVLLEDGSIEYIKFFAPID